MSTCFRRLATSILILLFSHPPLLAQESPAGEKNSPATTPSCWRFGSEIDVLPYATGGYYGSLFAGRNVWRLRAVVARTSAPSFLVAEGFEKKRTDAYALLTDRFLGSKKRLQQGIWIGGGGEFWRSRIRQEGTKEYAYYNNFSLTIGGGYAWKLTRHLYLNPWSAAHVVVGGDSAINVSGKTYKQPRFTPEASFKVGFVF